MKKYLLIILLLLIIPINLFAQENNYDYKGLEETLKLKGINADLSNYSENDSKLNIYLFWGNGCPHCTDYLNYVASILVKEYGSKVNFINYEVWKSESNSNLMKKVGNTLGIDNLTGVPFIVIGDEYFIGYSKARQESIKEAIDEALKTKIDIVSITINNDIETITKDEINQKEDVPEIESNQNTNNSNTESFSVEKIANENQSNLPIKIILAILIFACCILSVFIIIVITKLIKEK